MTFICSLEFLLSAMIISALIGLATGSYAMLLFTKDKN